MDSNKHTVYNAINNSLLRICKYVSYVSAVTLCIIMIVTTLDVIGTKVFIAPVKFTTEIVTWGNVLITFLSVAYVQMDQGHITIALRTDRFPKGLQLFFREIANILGTVTTGILTWQAFTRAGRDLASKTKAGSFDSFNIWPFAYAFAIGCALLTICFAWSIIRDFYRYKYLETKEVTA